MGDCIFSQENSDENDAAEHLPSSSSKDFTTWDSNEDQDVLIQRMQHAICTPLTITDVPIGTHSDYVWEGSSETFGKAAEEIFKLIPENTTNNSFNTEILLGEVAQRNPHKTVHQHLAQEGLSQPFIEIRTALNDLHKQRKDVEGKLMYAQAKINIREFATGYALKVRHRLLKDPTLKNNINTEYELQEAQKHFDALLAKFLAPLLKQREEILAEIAGYEIVMGTFLHLKPLRLIGHIIAKAKKYGTDNIPQ